MRRLTPIVTLGALTVLGGCRAWPWHTATVKDVFGEVGEVTEVDFAPYLALAHAAVMRTPLPPTLAPDHPGQRVFVTFWSPGHAAVRATALGKTLAESVRLASEEVEKTAEGEGRVEIEVVTLVQPGSVEADATMSQRLLGEYGYAVFDKKLEIGWVSPSEIVHDKLIDSREDKPVAFKTADVAALMLGRAGVSKEAFAQMTRERFKVDQWVESSPGKPPVHLFRSMPVHPTEITADRLLTAVHDAADYIARTCTDEGKFVYAYDPVTNEVEKGYDILRHAGATYALMDAYSEFHVETWKTAADRAIAHLERVLTTTPNGSYIAQNTHEEQQKVGGAGLMLVALSKYTEETHDKRHLATMQELAKFIVHQQYPDGHYRANADVEREDPTVDTKQFKKEVTYYPGEGTLGLIRLYAIDPDPKWLEAAKKAADFIVLVRDAKVDVKHQIQDHWMSYALLDLYGATKERRYADHAFKIGHAIVQGEIHDLTPSEADCVGAYFDKGPTTPSSTRLEALAAQIQLARWMGQEEGWLRGTATDIARFTVGQQLTADALYFVRNPDRVRGGVRESLLSSDVRIDYPQHALSGWLRFARELRDPTWGKLD